jgi:hypothetical protein
MKVIQFFAGEITARWQDCMDTVKAAAERAGLIYELHTELPAGIKGWGDAANLSDIFRNIYLSEYPEDIYLDCDIKTDSIYVPEHIDKPYFCFNPGVKNRVDVWAIHGNGHAEIFKKLSWYGEMCNKKIQVGQHSYSYLNFLMPKGSFYLIPVGAYQHQNFGSWIPGKTQEPAVIAETIKPKRRKKCPTL